MQNSNKKFTGKIAAALIEKDGKFFIAQRAKKDGLEGLWEFPGGKQEDGETIQECLSRELYEEFGVNASIGEYVCSSFFELKGKPTELLAFKVPLFSGDIQCMEHNKVEWVSTENLDKYTFTKPDLVFIAAIKKEKNRSLKS